MEELSRVLEIMIKTYEGKNFDVTFTIKYKNDYQGFIQILDF
ncbi:hypothetical protein P9E76_05860 [Schinkia azotoformans]|nr:hypothetical protein [Schinkia azotoformans]MEC1640547.1 hypothetical protein [Schinkia azotoformans]MEC1719438.1 hypothetical protein [Schinkia azotoformans]MEC1944568.1 hypothetical protein [Schinkia azotoformans]MED4415576.1 hypothetical protein [Schinkia azotoformans]